MRELMKLAVLLPLAVALPGCLASRAPVEPAPLCAACPACPAPNPSQALLKQAADEDLERVLKAFGFAYERIRKGTFTFHLAGLKVVLFGDEHNLQLYAGFRGRSSYRCVNQWNLSKRYSRSYIDKDGDPVLESDLDLAGGITAESINSFIATFRLSLEHFYQHISSCEPDTTQET